MANRISEWYADLAPNSKKRIHKSVYGGILVSVVVLFVYARKGEFKPLAKEVKEPAKKSININNKMLEITLTSEIDESKKRLAELERLNAEKKAPSAGTVPLPGQPVPANGASEKAPGANLISKLIDQRQKTNPLGNQAVPPQDNNPSPAPHTPMPAQPSGGKKTHFTTPAPPGEFGGEYSKESRSVKLTWAGEITHTKNDSVKDSVEPGKGDGAGTADTKKKGKKMVHLPVSFMAARTLNGLLVPATSDGKGDPYPLIIRVSAPAQLPNGITSQLSGCFFVTEAIGSLQQSRALVRVVSLTCLNKKEEAVIEADVRGFVEDSDGKPGLAGIVAAPKFGEMVRYSAGAGFLGGIGDGMALTSASNTISAAGPITSFGTSAQDIGLAAAGKGISGATKKINEVYSELLHQSLPVVEVGNGKKITVWVTKGVDLEIKNFKNINWY